jgi:hypothetical protein
MCSLAESARWMHLRPEAVDLAAIGREWLAIMSDGVARALAQRSDLGPGVVLDLPYDRLTEDPGTTLPALFEGLGARWGAVDEANLVAARAAPAKRPPHRYSLERFGLDRSEVHEAFADYVELLPALPRWSAGPGPARQSDDAEA